MSLCRNVNVNGINGVFAEAPYGTHFLSDETKQLLQTPTPNTAKCTPQFRA